MNIMDGMDAARFTSGNPDASGERRSAGERKKTADRVKSKMPQVLRNLNNR
ncbi:hypothetical protein [Paenibacillus sp.]|uniref:hypothetical protein n=1 Tax=Paenibacillus sp. TaxID=58172 RepID=UPI002D3A3758|nr:hypothetical protein [Paenibacillus sp.]HZG84762.1 hypothetical protein [Paenibacillus sp.]